MKHVVILIQHFDLIVFTGEFIFAFVYVQQVLFGNTNICREVIYNYTLLYNTVDAMIMFLVDYVHLP